jgi:hypothetical protein
MGNTYKFIKKSQNLVRLIEEGKVSKHFLDMHKPFSEGLCFACRKKLKVIKIIKTGSGIEYKFQCGHSLNIISLEEIKDGGSGFSNSRVGINSEGMHDVKIIRGGTKSSKIEDEMSVAKMFCHQHRPELSIFKNDIENSPYDIIGESKNKTIFEYFQITKLENQNFWKELSEKNIVDTILPNIEELVKNAIERKMKYSQEERNRIILLIDASPGVMKEIASQIKTKIANSKFKEIWLVGKTAELTHRIS